MKLRLRFVLLLAALAVGGAGAQEAVVEVLEAGRAVAKPMTETVDRDFVVHGGDLKLRNAVAGLAVDTKKALGLEVPEGDGWKHVIAIQFREQPAGDRRPRSLIPSFHLVPEGFRLQLDVYNLDRGLDHEALERAVLELLLYERCLRGRDPQGFEEELKLPWWLTEGLLESFRWRKREGDRELYEALFKSQAGASVERVLDGQKVEEMGAGERAIYRASAGTLVMALLRQEGGREGMASLLGEAAVFKGEQEALLKQHFPGMNIGAKSLQKWWALQLADLSKLSVTETMDALASEEALEKALVIRFEGGERGVLEFRPELYRDLLAIPTEQRLMLLKPVSDRLNLMAFTIFPGYRPILFGYLTILSDLAEEKDAEIDSRVASLAERRAEMVELGKRARDLLEWYRINTAEGLSGEFRDYLELKQQLEAERSENRGPVADYLRKVQEIFGE